MGMNLNPRRKLIQKTKRNKQPNKHPNHSSPISFKIIKLESDFLVMLESSLQLNKDF